MIAQYMKGPPISAGKYNAAVLKELTELESLIRPWLDLWSLMLNRLTQDPIFHYSHTLHLILYFMKSIFPEKERAPFISRCSFFWRKQLASLKIRLVGYTFWYLSLADIKFLVKRHQISGCLTMWSLDMNAISKDLYFFSLNSKIYCLRSS